MNRLTALVVLLLAGCAAQERSPAAEPPQTATVPAAPAETAALAQPTPPKPLSPRDTSRVEVGGAAILVDYGRPYMRGRTIMGGLVPYGEVWRTGANAATTLVTDADLRIGDVNIPRGTYTLYTLPGPDQWQLIVNRQTGQWGTEYHAEQDLARIPMQRSELAQPMEQFTIGFAPQGLDGANLVMEWENTRVSVPVRVVGNAQ